MKQYTDQQFKNKEIFILNITWILASFILLYYGISGDEKDMVFSFVAIIGLFLYLWIQGSKIKQKEYEEKDMIFGEKVTGQWGK